MPEDYWIELNNIESLHHLAFCIDSDVKIAVFNIKLANSLILFVQFS